MEQGKATVWPICGYRNVSRPGARWVDDIVKIPDCGLVRLATRSWWMAQITIYSIVCSQTPCQ